LFEGAGSDGTGGTGARHREDSRTGIGPGAEGVAAVGDEPLVILESSKNDLPDRTSHAVTKTSLNDAILLNAIFSQGAGRASVRGAGDATTDSQTSETGEIECNVEDGIRAGVAAINGKGGRGGAEKIAVVVKRDCTAADKGLSSGAGAGVIRGGGIELPGGAGGRLGNKGGCDINGNWRAERIINRHIGEGGGFAVGGGLIGPSKRRGGRAAAVDADGLVGEVDVIVGTEVSDDVKVDGSGVEGVGGNGDAWNGQVAVGAVAGVNAEGTAEEGL